MPGRGRSQSSVLNPPARPSEEEKGKSGEM